MSDQRATIDRLLIGHRRSVALIAATSIVGGLTEAAFLVVITRAAFAVTKGQESIGTLAGISFSVAGTVGVALTLVLVRIAMALFTNSASASLTARVTGELRTRLADAFLRSTWPAQQEGRVGHLQELLSSYANSGAQLINSFSVAVVAGCSLAAMMLIAAAVDPVGSLIAVVAVGLLGVALRPLRASVRRQARTFTDDSMALALATNEISGLGMAVHTFDVREPVKARVDELLAGSVESNRKLVAVRGLVPAIYSGLAYLALVGAVALASTWETAALTSLGAVMLVMLRSLSYGQQLQSSYSNIGSLLPQVHDVFDEIERYESNAFVDHGDPVEAACPLRLDDVSFDYRADVPVLRHVSAEIVPGEMVGIVGPSGSGKTTLVQLLLGLRRPTEGRVLAAGRDIRELRHTDWSRKVTFVPQVPALVSGTIADNIRFYRADVTDEQIRRAADLAGLTDDVAAFPDGYAHEVGDRGHRLSGGQQQRVCIARALVGDPELLILDEPTSALDAVTEAKVRDTLNTLRRTMAIVVIAHRLSTLDQCDRIMIVEEGRIAAFDTPAALRSGDNFYTEALQHSGLA